jgi:hypothetical protein
VVELSRAIGDSNQAAVRKAREGELETLVAASIAVAVELDQEALLPEIAKHVTVLCRCNTCAISSYSADDETLTVLADYDSRGRRTPTAGRWDLREYPATAALMQEQVPAVFNLDDRRVDPAERAQLVRAVSEPAGAAGAGALSGLAGAAGQADPLAMIATVVRDSFDALTVTVALDDTVAAAATAPAEAGAVESRHREAHVLTSAAGTPRGRLTISVVMPAAASDGESDLLEMTTAFAALLSTYAGESAAGGAPATTA